MLPLLAALAVCQTPSTGLKAVASDSVVQVASWLPADTETLVVAAAPGSFTDLDPKGKLADAARTLAFFGMPDPDSGEWKLSYNFVMEGSRNYGYPKDLGLMPYEGCTVVSFQPDQEAKAEAIIKKMANHSGVVEGQGVYVIQKKLEQDPWTWYVFFDGPYMVCATNKPFLIELLRRRRSPQEPRALPDALEQWKYISPQAPFFAVRNFTERSHHLGAGANMEDPQLVGYAIWIAKDRQKLNLVSISDNPNGFKIVQDLWVGFLKQERWTDAATATALDTRATEVCLNAQSSEPSQPLFILAMALGHGIFV